MAVRLDTRAGALPAVGAAVGSTAAVGLLLRRMRSEFESRGELSAPTTAVMYAGYAAHAGATAVAARDRAGTLGLSSRPALVAGCVLGAAGTALSVAGMSRFAGPAQISGTDVGGLASGGVYRYSRNPQYVGYVGVLAGAGLARRSGVVLVLAGAAAAVFGWWVPVEERHLDAEFGDAYRRYRDRVPRWLGRGRARRAGGGATAVRAEGPR